jgi:hypothetical protein
MWRLLVYAAKKGAAEAGYTLSRVPGRGLSNIWNLQKNGETQVASIRTTRDRWIAFPPMEGGKRWKTLDEVDLVVVAALDSKDDPKNVEVYIFPATDVRHRFDAAYAARTEDDHMLHDGFGMWVNLDPDNRVTASSVGSGIIQDYKQVALYPMATLVAEMRAEGSSDELAEPEEALTQSEQRSSPRQPATIAEVMAWARERVAEMAGVRVEAVKLDLKLEY